MLGLGLALSVAKGVIDEIGGLLSKLARRSTYSENLADSRAVVSDIDSYDLLDKATILLTPTATSDARVHSVKTYTGDELVTNGTFDTDLSGWTGNGVYDNGRARVDVVGGGYVYIGQNYAFVDGNTYKLTFNVNGTSGKQIRTQDEGNNTGGLTTSNGTWTLNGSEQEFDVIWTANSNSNQLLFARTTNTGDWSFSIDNISVIDVSSDFDFDRASSATRINSSGLVQDMQSITDPELVLNGDFEELGDEEVTNGTFDTDNSDWSKSNSTISGGKGNLDGDGQVALLWQDILTNGNSYKTTFTVSDYNGLGEARIINNDGGVIYNITSNGTFTIYFTHNIANGNFLIRAKSGAVFSIDNVSVKQVDPNDRWTLGTGWSIEDGKLVGDGTNTGFSSAQQNNLTVSGNTYQITLTVEAASGAIELKGAGVYTRVDSLGVGTHTLTFVADATYFRFLAHAGATATIDNVSVKDITFSEDVDLARINYDSNGENGHWLLEPTSTNLITYSEDFENGYTKVNSSVDLNDAVAPDGTTTANKFNSTALSSKIHKSYQNSSALFHTVSIFLKKGTIDIVSLQVSGASPDINASTTVNLTSGTITASSGNGSITPTITNYGNDWYKITASSTSNGNIANPTIFIVNSSTTASGYFYMWGLQFEGLPYSTSYIPNHGTAVGVTRATETLTGSGNSTLINSTEGVLYLDIAMLSEDDKASNNQLFISDGTANQRVGIFTESAGDIRAQIRDNGETPSSRNLTALDQSESGVDTAAFNKIAILYKSGQNKLFVNGSRITDTNFDSMVFNFSSLDNLEFGSGANSNYFRGKVKALAVFNEALSDTELTNLTS